MAATIESVEKVVQENYVPEFHYLKYDSTPFQPFTKDLASAKGALITTGGVFLKGEPPFQDNYGLGDPSYREIPSDVETKKLVHYHEHYDHTNASKDINCIFPIERMRQLAKEGTIGPLAETFYSFMGFVPIAHPLLTRTAPQVARKLKKELVDYVLIAPV